MSITDIIYTVIAGGLLGAMGQGIRIAVGLKKLSDSNAQKIAKADVDDPPEKMDSGRLWVSIFIGFVAGAIGMIIKGTSLKGVNGYQTEAVVTIIAIGYAGADFVEGFFQTYLNKVKNIAAPASAAITIAATPPVIVSVESTSAGIPAEEEPELVADEYIPQHNNALG
jgi:hypothetical protein